MKVTLDLSKLLHDGAITAEEHDRLATLGRQDTGLLLVNVLVGFGVLAVAGGAVALVPTPLTAVLLGSALMATGLGLLVARREWAILANICILVAALMLASGIILLSQGVLLPGGDGDAPHGSPLISFNVACLLVAALFAGSAALARSNLLAVLTVLVLFTVLGSSSAYEHAFYELEVRQPLATVAAFSALGLAAHAVSLRLRGDWERLAITVARTSVFLVNLGFWVGSLWGDGLDWLPRPYRVGVPPWVFSMAWAVALLGAALVAGRNNRRWVLNPVTVFAGIHFYTQWFEHLGATPGSVLVAGVLVLVLAVLLWWLNRSPRSPASQPA